MSAVSQRVELQAEPEAIFLPKFENATSLSRQQYEKIAAAQQHVLVAAIKSSGSLFLATARAGVLVVASKNGLGNVYADCGHYVLIRHLQEAHGRAWRTAYNDLVRVLEQYKLSLGCELVTRSLGEHAETPAKDHLVVNAVLDRRTMAAVSPLLLLRICRQFGLVAPGMYMYKGPDAATKFLQAYDNVRWKTDATWDELHAVMFGAAWRVVKMPYPELHSQVLEGFVCSWIPLTYELEQWAAQPTVAHPEGHVHVGKYSDLPLESLFSALPAHSSIYINGLLLAPLDDLVADLETQHPVDTSRQRLAKLQCRVRAQIRKSLESQHCGAGAGDKSDAVCVDEVDVSGTDECEPSAASKHVLQNLLLELLASARQTQTLARQGDVDMDAASDSPEGDARGAWGAGGFLAMLGAP